MVTFVDNSIFSSISQDKLRNSDGSGFSKFLSAGLNSLSNNLGDAFTGSDDIFTLLYADYSWKN